jgi:hypothetical protein
VSRIPPCAEFLGCLCAGHARGLPSTALCDTTEQDPCCCDVHEPDESCCPGWGHFNANNIDEAMGFEVVSVEMISSGRTAERDEISGATDEQEEAIHEWLGHAGWDAFCSDNA